MEEHKITQIIIHYLGKYHEELKGALPNEGYFLVEGASDCGFSTGSRIAHGTAIDVLADTIENNKYFGSYVTDEVEQAINPNNAKIKPLRIGDKLTARCEITITEAGLSAELYKVEPKPYLNEIKTKEWFMQTAKVLGVEGDLEQIASELYTS